MSNERERELTRLTKRNHELRETLLLLLNWCDQCGVSRTKPDLSKKNRVFQAPAVEYNVISQARALLKDSD